jgi:hypothetical protein
MPPKTSSIYPSSISRALCSDGMRCIKPLAPSRNETNSSRVNGGADGAILGICAYGRPDQAGNRRFPRWPVSDGLQGGKPTAPARASAEWRCRTADRIDPARVSPSRHNPGRSTFASDSAIVRNVLIKSGHMVPGQRSADLAASSADRCHHFKSDPRRTSSPYIQI